GDLYFDPDYVGALVAPILSGAAIGSCHGTERVANPDNLWSRCLQMKCGFPPDLRLRLSPDEMVAGSIIFRALRRDLFVAVGGFDDTGHTDDQTLFPKLQSRAMFVPEAICYHYNVETLSEVFGQGVWGGTSVYLEYGPRALLYYVLPRSLIRAIGTGIRHRSLAILVYDVVVEAGIFLGLLKRTLRFDRTYGR